jgi:hypothetical protein
MKIIISALLAYTANCESTCISSPIEKSLGLVNSGNQFSDLARLQLLESSDYVLRLKQLKFCADAKGNLVGI